MFSLRKDKPLVVLGLTITLAAGCTATGALDIAKFVGTIFQVAALNYTGPLVSSVDAVVTAFTGQPVQRPEVQQYPMDGQYGGQGYPDQQYPGYQYPDTQDPGYQYPDSQYPEYQYPSAQDPGYQYPSNQYPSEQNPSEQYPSQQYPSEQYPSQQPAGNQYPSQQPAGNQYPSQQYPNQQYPSEQYPSQQSAGNQYPNQQYPNQQHPSNQYPDSTGGGYSQPSWESWGNAFPDPAARAVPDEGALSIDLALFTTVNGELVVMPDGARLRDGVGRTTPGDRFGIAFATNEPAYVYIVNIDATGWGQTLFPYPDVPGFDNPVAAGAQVILPNEQMYGLDDTRGVETVFVMVSRTPNLELESALGPLRGMERAAMVGTRGATARVSVPMVGQRGLVGVIPGANKAQNVSLDRFFTERSTNELAFSRWFVHE